MVVGDVVVVAGSVVVGSGSVVVVDGVVVVVVARSSSSPARSSWSSTMSTSWSSGSVVVGHVVASTVSIAAGTVVSGAVVVVVVVVVVEVVDVEVDVDVDVDVEVEVDEVDVEVAAAVVVEPATVVEVTEVGSGPVVTDTDGTVDDERRTDGGARRRRGGRRDLGLGGQRIVGLFVVAAREDHQGDDAEDHGDGPGSEGDERAGLIPPAARRRLVLRLVVGTWAESGPSIPPPPPDGGGGMICVGSDGP